MKILIPKNCSPEPLLKDFPDGTVLKLSNQFYLKVKRPNGSIPPSHLNPNLVNLFTSTLDWGRLEDMGFIEVKNVVVTTEIPSS